MTERDESERGESDAAFFHQYGIGRKDAADVLSTFKGIHERSPLLPGGVSVADRIIQKFEAFGAAMG